MMRRLLRTHALLSRVPVLLLAVLFLACSGCATSTGKGYVMHSKGMEPSIFAGTPLRIDETVYKTDRPQRHDFVGFRPSFLSMDVFVFRVVGLPGEAISMTQKGLWIDGKPFAHPGGGPYSTGSRNDIAVALQDEEYFLLGDNQSMAIDSRHLGPAHRINILGKIIGVPENGD